MDETDVTVPEDFVSRQLLSLDSNLRCGICRDFFKAPVLLVTCSHTFCSRCIRESLSVTARCPVCRVDAHEGSLKKNSIIDSIVACWTLARPDLVALQKQSLAVASSSKFSTTNPQNKRSHSSSSVDLTVDDSKHASTSKRTRYGTRANSGDGKSASASTSKRDSKGKGKLKREESDHDRELASSDVEIVEPKSKFLDPTDPNIKVQCPSCDVTMTNAQLNRHLDSGCDGIAREVPQASKADWSHLMGTQATKSKQSAAGKKKDSARATKQKEKSKESTSPAVETKIALLNYSGMSLKNLKEHLEDLNLSSTIPDGVNTNALDYLKRRHKQFALLHNANLDFTDLLDARRRSREHLEEDLNEWEKLQDKLKPGAGSKTVKDAGKWEAHYAEQFKELRDSARRSHEASKAKRSNGVPIIAKELGEEPIEMEEEKLDDPLPAAVPSAFTSSTLNDTNSTISRPSSPISHSPQPQYVATAPRAVSECSPPPYPASTFLANRYSVALAQKEALLQAKRAKEDPVRWEKREVSPFDPEGPKPSQRERIEYYDEEDEEEQESSMETLTTGIVLGRDSEVEEA